MLLSRAVSRYASRTAGIKHAPLRPARISHAQQFLRKSIRTSSSLARPLGAAVEEAASSDAEEEGYGLEPCSPAFVVADNSHPHYTQFSVDVADYPGLLRVITWVMNGMSCRVHNAVLKSSEDGMASDVFWVTDLRGRKVGRTERSVKSSDDGMASDVFWVTDLRGRKLSDAAANDLADRLEEFVSYCAPPSKDGEFTEYTCGDISISNLSHPQCTEVTVVANIFSPGLLFEMSSIFHGQGIAIVEGLVRGGSESPIPPDMLAGMSGLAAAAAGGSSSSSSSSGSVPDPPAGMRVMRFWVKKGKSGSKLDYADVSALLYTLRVVLGDGGLPTQPPNSELNDLACPCSDTDDGGSGGVNAVRGAGTAKGRFTMA
ncbi:hypothetical protein OEZ85_013464 [Tetradesmus obliquus]|uniref:ACT domain-containing protein n=1 Tax=Tetradesmus obliquus TaxID=3088 RepID=A0ABY8UTU3_TETOB|nr:hypothetical protein OEZ85_013464 [Tetradesmus obliquus]